MMHSFLETFQDQNGGADVHDRNEFGQSRAHGVPEPVAFGGAVRFDGKGTPQRRQ
eukprot:CAMPEP_0175102634 /NCGR_PEP_ID=MMETSP0086_2-20121207/8571_1 /TAXON_ID=136419 /ORGANISM="Unknown Unknown, Strain D1" /LENGTH=54 /DNA_ID=CAMNT_0016377517 /DNA_START=238 /DNA_END=402 /DNA_ORIENTATION=-